MNSEAMRQNDYAEKMAKTFVRSGFYDRDRAVEAFLENCPNDDETGEAKAEKLVDAEFEKKAAE